MSDHEFVRRLTGEQFPEGTFGASLREHPLAAELIAVFYRHLAMDSDGNRLMVKFERSVCLFLEAVTFAGLGSMVKLVDAVVEDPEERKQLASELFELYTNNIQRSVREAIEHINELGGNEHVS